MNCQGCDPKCNDPAKRYKVISKKYGLDWGDYYYCARAAKIDEANGFEVVEVVTPEPRKPGFFSRLKSWFVRKRGDRPSVFCPRSME